MGLEVQTAYTTHKDALDGDVERNLSYLKAAGEIASAQAAEMAKKAESLGLKPREPVIALTPEQSRYVENYVAGLPDSKKEEKERLLSLAQGEAIGLRPYEDNCEELANLCEQSGQKPGEALRDLVDEALRARRTPLIAATGIMETLEHIVEQNRQLVEQNRVATERCERLLEKCERMEERGDSLKRGVIQNLREFYAMLLETLSASIGARRLAWNYVARTILVESGFTEEQIKQRYEIEKRAWIEEREKIAEALEEAVERMQQRD